MRCGRSSDHVVREDAQVEMELFECEIHDDGAAQTTIVRLSRLSHGD